MFWSRVNKYEHAKAKVAFIIKGEKMKYEENLVKERILRIRKEERLWRKG